MKKINSINETAIINQPKYQYYISEIDEIQGKATKIILFILK